MNLRCFAVKSTRLSEVLLAVGVGVMEVELQGPMGSALRGQGE